MRLLIPSIVFCAAIVASPAMARQGAAPKLNKTQRDLLQALVSAVDAAAASPATADAEWHTHVLRTSDGAHYVAFTVRPSESLALPAMATLYVRLATRIDPQNADASVEHSAVMDWLKGMRSDPRVSRTERGIAFGEMPVFGAGAVATRGPGQQAGDLALLSLERERARERKEAAEKERKVALEGKSTARARDPLFPFEDFAVGVPIATSAEARLLRRSVTAGAGDYDLYVAWSEAPARGKSPAIHVLKRSVSLPPAFTTQLGISSVILAEEVGVRAAPYPPDQQSSHPYAIGPMEIVPAERDGFTNDQRLAVVFQVFNARANDLGKPDIAVGFQLLRITDGGERSVGMLNPQYYNGTTLPADFDLTKGHPIFVAMAAPLKTLPRGEYRLRIGVTDKLAARNALTDATFHVVATPATLLAAAPISTPLPRDYLLESDVLQAVAARLQRDRMTPALSTALAAARAKRFVDLLREDEVAPEEQGLRTTLRGIGLFALGDPRVAVTLLRQALQLSPNAAAQLYLGACRALDGNDRDAISAWQSAIEADMPAAIVTPLIVDAHLRLGEIARAGELARAAVANGGDQSNLARALATVHIAEGREGAAIALLDKHLAEHGDDLEAQYVMLHALFASIVHARGSGTTSEDQERFRALAQGYITAKARYATTVAEWLDIASKR